MKFSQNKEVIRGLTLKQINKFIKTNDLAHLKGNDPNVLAAELYEREDLSQPGWKALMRLDFTLFNMKRAKSYKALFNAKFGYIFENLKSHTAIAKPTEDLREGLRKCIRHRSDLPYYEEFYRDYFLEYSIDSIIDMAYTLPENEKEMCKTLLISSCQYYRDNRLHIELPHAKRKKQEGKTIELSNVYLDVRYKDEIWPDDDKVVLYLVEHYAVDIKHTIFPMEGFLATKSDEQKLKDTFKEFNIGSEKYRFLKLAQKAQEELSAPKNVDEAREEPVVDADDNSESSEDTSNGTSHIASNVASGITSVHDTTNIDVLDTPIEETAEEVAMSITTPHETRTKQKASKEKVRRKENIDYAEQQRISQKIGDRGEELVLMSEIQKVKEWGLPAEMVEQVRRVSLESDDYGFDILSFDKDGNERYLEVKSTKQNKKDFSFILTRNEFDHAKSYGEQYSFVIVFDILKNPRIWYMGNPFLEEPYKVNIQPTQYKVDVGTTEL